MQSKVKLTHPETFSRDGEPVDISLWLLRASFIPVTPTVVPSCSRETIPALVAASASQEISGCGKHFEM